MGTGEASLNTISLNMKVSFLDLDLILTARYQLVGLDAGIGGPKPKGTIHCTRNPFTLCLKLIGTCELIKGPNLL